LNGEQLRKARLRLGFSLRQFAREIKIPFNTIARWERGEIEIRHPYILKLAIDHLKCVKKHKERK
jgi:transcriptional regulator with XRE-family HTH domain